jgi:energy-coupling factor transporter ATP-binding protein EcfA2
MCPRPLLRASTPDRQGAKTDHSSSWFLRDSDTRVGLIPIGNSTIEHALRLEPGGRWLIAGPPGAGKTTLLRVLTLECARATDDRVPILIDLGRYRTGDLTNLRLAAETFKHLDPLGLEQGDLEKVLERESVTWFLDSLDEALIGNHGARSHEVWDEVEELVSSFPEHSFIVSCRSSHLPIEHNFTELSIRNFDRTERDAFTERYLRFFDIEATAEEVICAIPEQALPLVTTPLLMSMMISSYVSDGQIPASVDELYRQFICQILQRIEADRPCKVPPYVKDLTLATIAFEILVSGRSAIQKRSALQLLARRIGQLFDRGEISDRFSADVLFEELVYSGIIVDGGPEPKFLHLTLLEYFAACEMNREYSFVAQSEMDQYFLRNPKKIHQLVQAAGIRAGDRVVEVGAGIGSVARQLPDSRSLTLVDLDSELADILRFQFPKAQVIQGDAVGVLQSEEFDVVISNLPFFLTTDILDVPAKVPFRVAVMSVRADEELSRATARLKIENVLNLDEEDFFPRQPFKSRVVRVLRG